MASSRKPAAFYSESPMVYLTSAVEFLTIIDPNIIVDRADQPEYRHTCVVLCDPQDLTTQEKIERRAERYNLIAWYSPKHEGMIIQRNRPIDAS